MELGVIGQHLKLLVENFQAFLRDFVGDEVVDADLHVVEAGLVKPFNALDIEEIAVGDHAGDGAGFPHAADDVVEVRMGEGLAAGDADHGGAEAAEMVDAAEHLVCGHGRGDFVELVAVGAGEIAEARGNDLDEDRVRGRGEGACDHCVLAGFASGADGATTDRVSAELGHLVYFRGFWGGKGCKGKGAGGVLKEFWICGVFFKTKNTCFQIFFNRFSSNPSTIQLFTNSSGSQ